MKILFLTKYIYEESLKEFTRNKTGFGLMVNDILKSVANSNDVRIITRVITSGKKFSDYEIVKHKWSDVFSKFSFKYFFYGLLEALKSKESTINMLKIVYFYLDCSYVKDYIKKFNPDIVHIHGIGESSKAYIKMCEELNIQYAVTLHGLIGLDSSVRVSEYNRKIEKSFLEKSNKKNVPVSVISTGVKKRIVENYAVDQGNNIVVIPNGTSLKSDQDIPIDIRKVYGIPEKNRIIVCIGNLSNRKNQIQIIEAFSLLRESTKNTVSVLFLGGDQTNNALRERSLNLFVETSMIFCGFVDKKDVGSYLEQADLNVVSSLSEGFGLSMIEGFVHGVPTVTFSDLDAIRDIYDAKAVLLADNRSNDALAQAMEAALEKKWDRDWIKKYSEKFSLESMAEAYQNFYQSVCKKA